MSRAAILVGTERETRGAGTSAPDFADFVRTNLRSLLRSAYLLSGSAADAEDLVQETLTGLLPKWDRVVAQADNPLAYVRRSLVNAFLNQRRRPVSRREVVVDLLPERADGVDIAGAVGDRDEVWYLLGTLGARQRAALVLRYFHDLDDDEIAAALDCRVGTVRSRISRGLAILREHSAASREGNR